IASGKINVQLPRLQLRDFNHHVGVLADIANLELRHRCRRTRPAQREAAAVEVQITTDRAAASGGANGQWPGDRRSNVVAVEQSRPSCVELEVEPCLAAGEIDRAVSGNRAAARSTS